MQVKTREYIKEEFTLIDMIATHHITLLVGQSYTMPHLFTIIYASYTFI